MQNVQIQFHPSHAQSLIWALALHWYILKVCSKILLADNEDPDKSARMRRPIWTFAVRICPKTHFRGQYIEKEEMWL